MAATFEMRELCYDKLVQVGTNDGLETYMMSAFC